MAKVDEKDVIKFKAQVSKVTTLSDGGIRLVFDISELDIEVAKKMMEVKQAGALLEIAAVAVKVKNGRKSRKTATTDDSSATY